MTMLEKVAEAMWRTRIGSAKFSWAELGTIKDEFRDMARAAIQAFGETNEGDARWDRVCRLLAGELGHDRIDDLVREVLDAILQEGA